MRCKLLESHIYVNVRGSYQSCCISTDKNNKETIQNTTPQEWLNSDLINRSKEMLSNGEWPPQCGTCKFNEENGIQSDRQSYQHLGDEVEFLDLRFSNKCNLKCISCGPESSSSIYEENIQMRSMGVIPIHTQFNSQSDNWFDDNILENFMAFPLKKVKFLGGEPMMVKYVPDCLDKLSEDVSVHLTSNLTLFNPRIYNALKKFKSATISASVDAIGSKIEYIRYGSNWGVIESNILKYSEVSSINLAVCVSVLNILYLDEIQKFADNLNIPVNYYLLYGPSWLDIKNAPPIIRNAGNRFYKLDDTYDSTQIEIFKKNISKLDSFRKISIKDYLPEVAAAYNM